MSDYDNTYLSILSRQGEKKTLRQKFQRLGMHQRVIEFKE